MKKHLVNHKMDLGILVIRIGIGITFIIHGYPKVFGGAQKWEKLGGAAAKVGLDFLPAFWGFMAAFSEFFGGVLLILGLFFRPATALLLVTMIFAANQHFVNGDDFGKASHAIEAAILFLGLFITGPGIHSFDDFIFSRRLK